MDATGSLPQVGDQIAINCPADPPHPAGWYAALVISVEVVSRSAAVLPPKRGMSVPPPSYTLVVEWEGGGVDTLPNSPEWRPLGQEPDKRGKISSRDARLRPHVQWLVRRLEGEQRGESMLFTRTAGPGVGTRGAARMGPGGRTKHATRADLFGTGPGVPPSMTFDEGLSHQQMLQQLYHEQGGANNGDNTLFGGYGRDGGGYFPPLPFLPSGLPVSTITLDHNRPNDVEWIRCCNPFCGKWRALPSYLSAGQTLRSLALGPGSNGKSVSNPDDDGEGSGGGGGTGVGGGGGGGGRGSFPGQSGRGNFPGQSGQDGSVNGAYANVWSALNPQPKWYCVLNFWDEAVSSCSAPQETRYMEAGFERLVNHVSSALREGAGHGGGMKKGATAGNKRGKQEEEEEQAQGRKKGR